MTLTDLPGHRGGRTVLVIGDALLDGWLDGTFYRMLADTDKPQDY